MRTRARFWTMLAVLLTCWLAAGQYAAAQEDPEGNPGGDPPSRVARLSLADGAVSFNPAGTEDWLDAVLNRPLSTGDKLWTDQNSRAELQIGSSEVRLSAMTGFSFLNLDDQMMQIRLTERTVNIRVRRLQPDEAVEIDTPNLAFTLLRPGRYRVNVSE